jgi:hypothetical protein
MQALFDLRSGCLESVLPDAEQRRDRSAALERFIAQLQTASQQLESGDIEDLTGPRLDDGVQESIASARRSGEQFLTELRSDETDPASLVDSARWVSRACDRAADDVDEFADEIGLEARLLERSVPRHLRTARYACLALAGVALVILGLVVVERLKFPPSRRELKRDLADQLRNGRFRDPSGATVAPADRPNKPGVPSRAPIHVDALLHSRPLHHTFTARVRLSSGRIDVWGKRYNLLGTLRGSAIPFVAMYGPGTWRILNAFERHAIDGPRPIAFGSLRFCGFPVQQTVLASHIGSLISAKRGFFSTKRFRQLDKKRRAVALDRLCELIDRLSAAGCFQLKLRYVHLRAASPAELDVDRPAYVLCDLDKVLFAPGWPDFVKRRLARHDRRRIVRNLGGDITSSELTRMRAWANGDQTSESAVQQGR